jgi:DNA polymerase
MSKTEKMRKVKDDVIALKGTELYDFRISTGGYPVIGEGSHDASIVFVGEAPGRNEAKTGKPFCGAAGKILDDLLESISVPREDVYITNIVKDRPPKNRDPLPEEIKLYAPFLDRQIDIIEPKCIATLGRFSMEYIMKAFGLDFEIEPISKAHGKKFVTTHGGKPLHIVPLYHPAAAIYNRALVDTLKEDFKILKQFV